MVQGSKFKVQGSRFKVQGLRFQVSSFKFQVSSFKFQVSGFKFQVSGFKSYCCALEEGVTGDQHKKALVGHVAIEVAEFDFGGATVH